jgi:hypothetical protein
MNEQLKRDRLREMERNDEIDQIAANFSRGGACYFCGCHKEGTIEYEDGEIINCPICNKDKNENFN